MLNDGLSGMSFQDALRTILENIGSTIRLITPVDVIDMILIAFVIYSVMKLVRDTRAVQLVKGIVLFLLVYLVIQIFQFKVMGWLMDKVLLIGATALVVVFQPELRRILERIGRTRLSSFGLFGNSSKDEERVLEINEMIEEFSKASESLSKHKIGALMVFEMQTRLGEIVKTGTTIDGKPVAELICNIFFPNSPLHDGAMVIRDARLLAAGCFLPLTENNDLSKELGTRHRASLGMSENSDAVVVVVSEETGTISIARNGVLTRNYTPETLAEYLRAALLPGEPARGWLQRLPLRRSKK